MTSAFLIRLSIGTSENITSTTQPVRVILALQFLCTVDVCYGTFARPSAALIHQTTIHVVVFFDRRTTRTVPATL
jgi:hypothetical protein